LAFRLGDEPRRFCIEQQYFHYFVPLLENPNWNIAGWNVKYDAHISWNCKVNIWNARQVIDGLALANLHDENKRDKGLKSCAKDFCGLQMTPFKALFKDCTDPRTGKPAKEFETPLALLPRGPVSDYASYDAYCHLVTVEWLIDKLSNTYIDLDGYSLWQYFLDMEMKITEILWRMERRGMHVDIDYLNERIPVITKAINDLEREIARIVGFPMNLQSPQQLAGYFFTDPNGMQLEPVKMTKGGAKGPQPSTDEEVMKHLSDAGIEVADMILSCRKLNKTKGTYLEALANLAQYFEDGRIHPGVNQFGAVTGRFSTNNPNSQNFPRPDKDEWGIRKAFTAPAGKKLIVADYEQLEMRIMAHMSGDENMIQAILDGKDLHSFTAASMLPGVKYEEVASAKKAKDPDARQKELLGVRQDMKAVGFGIIYGAGPPKISTSITIPDADIAAVLEEMEDKEIGRKVRSKMKNNKLLTEEEAIERVGREKIAARKIQDYFNVFPGVKEFMTDVPAWCRYSKDYDSDNNPREWEFEVRIPGALPTSESGHTKPFGYVQTLCGRYRRLPDIAHSSFFWRSEAERQSVNTRIQGSAADLTKGAMLRVEENEKLNRLGVMLLNQVHDELVMEVPEENAELAAPIIRECMEHPFQEGEEPLDVPIPVDLKIVDDWAAAK
jgi:DNA polymerase-1